MSYIHSMRKYREYREYRDYRDYRDYLGSTAENLDEAIRSVPNLFMYICTLPAAPDITKYNTYTYIHVGSTY